MYKIHENVDIDELCNLGFARDKYKKGFLTLEMGNKIICIIDKKTKEISFEEEYFDYIKDLIGTWLIKC